MERYSYRTSQRKKRINKILGTIVRFHLTHQNLILLVLGFIFAYLLIRSELLYGLTLSLTKFGYGSALALGFLFSFGSLTVPAATALFILARNFNPLIIALVASAGASVSNFLIYRGVKDVLLEEVRNVLSKDFKIDVSNIEQKINKRIYRSKFFQNSIPALSGILVSLPLPTEVFVSILWTVARYDTKKVLIYSFIFSFIGILSLAFLSHAVS